MNSLKNALLKSVETDVVVRIYNIEGNKKKFDKVFKEIRQTLSGRYTIFADTEKNEIFVQY